MASSLSFAGIDKNKSPNLLSFASFIKETTM